MTRHVDLIELDHLILGKHDKEDMTVLGTFLLAMARCDFERLGLVGAGKLQVLGKDYIVKFSNGIAGRPTINGATLFRKGECPADGACSEKTTWSSTSKNEFCTHHRCEFLELDEIRGCVA